MALTKIKTEAIADDAVTTDKLANAINTERAANTAKTSLEDESVTLAKLEHGTSSNDGKFLRANNGADPTFESLPSSGATLSGSTNNTVVTVTGANAMQGEGNVFIDEQGDLGLGISDITPTASTYNGATLQLHQTQSGSYGSQIKMTTGSGGYGSGDGFYIAHWGGNNSTYIYNKENAPIYFGTNATERAIIDEHLTISDGNLVIGTSGHGIDFSATANSSATGSTMSNELLDDYEEGSWTPQIRKYVNGSFGTAAGMADNGTVQRSKYTKIGDMVTVHLHWNGFQVSDANYAALGGLPFNSTSNGGGGGTVGYTNAFTSNQNQGILVGANGDNIYFYVNSNGWNGWSTSSNRDIYLTATYFTS